MLNRFLKMNVAIKIAIILLALAFLLLLVAVILMTSATVGGKCAIIGGMFGGIAFISFLAGVE